MSLKLVRQNKLINFKFRTGLAGIMSSSQNQELGSGCKAAVLLWGIV